MKPPGAPEAGKSLQAGGGHPAVSVCPKGGCPMETLTKRSDFLAASRARRQAMPGFILQGRQRRSDEAPAPLIRVGYTCSKKVGNAVARNRAKRRLRALARTFIPTDGTGGWDYVLVGRAATTGTLAFEQLSLQLQHALERIHRKSR